MNNSAIYTVIDKGRESYFLSSIAGGYSYPFYIFNYADRMARVVNENYPMGEVSVSEIFPLMKANHNFPENVHGEHLFRTVPDHTAVQRIDEMKSSDDTAFCVTLDYDERKIGFVFNKNCPEIRGGSHREVFQKLMVIDLTVANETNNRRMQEELHTPVCFYL